MDYEGSRGNETDSELSYIAPDIAAAVAAAARTGGVPLLPDAQNVVVLPQGASLDDIAVRGRDLVIQLADGRVFVIPDGAVFVPQIVVDGVAVPPLNLAALLIGEQPQPAAGPVQSSGGNFAEPSGPIQDAFGLGDLLPYTELLFPQVQSEELFPVVDHEPEVLIFTPDNLLGAIAATASVREEGLPSRGSEPQGSNAPANSETTTGTIVFESLDGLRSVTINGAAITAVGQTFASDKGVLTITSLTPGNYGYSYTLTDNTSGDATSDAFAVTVTDTDGDVATATLTIAIVDDVPTARNDTDTIPAGTFGPATGNVISGIGTTNAPGSADTVGADNAQVSRIASNNVPANVDSTFNADGDLEVAGQYGVLTIKADGGYSYLRNPNTPGGRDEVFTYTLTDGDGDNATATLTIAIGDAAPRVLDLTPKASGGDALVDEDDLSDGSDLAKESLTATGTFTVASPDGVGSLAVDGHTVVTDGVFTAASWTTPLGNTLAVTGYNAATGVVTYTYTLLDNESHPPAGGENALFEDFAVTLTDLDGDAASDTLSVQIVDDVPTARGDTDTLPNASTQESGNVITGVGTTSGNAGADTQGADGAAVSGLRAGISGNFASAGSTVTGQFGTLTLGANGGYTYTRSGNAGSGQTDTFSYQLTDGDGDVSTATLVITIPDRPAAVTSVPTTGGGTNVNEAGLPTRGSEPPGTNEPASSETTTGTITFSTPDGFGSLQINGTTITGTIGQPIPTPQGNLIVTGFNPAAGTLTYSYTLPDNTIGDNAINGGNTTITLSVTVTDTDGDTDTKPFVITIVDDAPIPRDDTDSVASGTLVATGNILTGTDFGGGDTNLSDGVGDTPGADGATLTKIVSIKVPANFDDNAAGGFDVAGLHGTLHVDADGDYTYTRNANTPGGVVDDFTYTLTDGDGDIRTAVLSIGIDNRTPAGGTANVVLDDDDVNANGIAGVAINGDLAPLAPSGPLPDPSQGDAPLTYSFPAPGAAPSGFTYDTASANTLKIFQTQGANQVLVVTVTLIDPVTGAYTVVQNATIRHAAGGNENNADFAIAYQVKDQDDQTATGTLNIRVNDDMPVATVADRGVPGLVLDESANGTDTTGAVSPAGRSTITADFSANFNSAAYGADGAGSVSYALLLSANGIASGLHALDTTDVLVDGDGYGQGAQILLSQGGNTITGAVGATPYFTLVINPATGVVTFTQLANIWHPNAGSSGAAHDDAATLLTALASDIKVQQTVTDADSDSATASVDIGRNVFSIQDDGPAAVNDTDTTGAPLSVATGNVITDLAAGDAGDTDTGADKTGTDGATIAGLVSVNVPASPDTDAGSGFSVAGAYGTLTMQTNGDYSYTRNANTPGGAHDVFTYTLKDGDGDTATATLDITLGNAAPAGGTANVVLDDDDVNANGIAGVAINGDLDPLAPSGPLPDPSQGDAPLTYSFPAPGVAPAGFTYDTATANTLKIFQTQGANQVLVVTVTLTDPATGDYTVVQNATILHASGGNENNVDFAIAYQVKDADLQTATGTLNIKVNDDTPTATASANSTVTAIVDETSTTTTAATLGAANIGNDPDVADLPSASGYIAHAVTGGAVVTPGGGYGADGAGSLSYALSVTNATSGLLVTDGSAIDLVLEGSIVVGRVQGGSFANQAAFAIGIDASNGVVTVEQYLSLKHPSNPNPDEVLPLGPNTLGVTVTRTDADNDSTTSAAADISGQIQFRDDGPTANPDTDTVTGGTLTATGNVISGTGTTNAPGSADKAGADGGARVTFIDHSDANPGAAVPNGGAVDMAGQYGTLNIASTGVYTYTRNANTPNGVQDQFTYTLIDGDGDTVTTTLTITVNNATPAAGTVNATLDDDALTNGIAGDNSDGTDANPDTSNLGGTLPDPLAGDAPLTYLLSAGVTTAGGAANLTYVLTGDVLEIKQGGVTAITVTLTDHTAGTYTIFQNKPLVHANAGSENNQTFAIPYSVTDQDGQVANGTINIDVDDDTPRSSVGAAPAPQLVLDESASGTDTASASLPAGRSAVTVSFAGNFNAAQYGADGAGSVGYALVLNGSNVASGLSALDTTDVLADGDGYGQGAPILLNQSGNTITGAVGADTYFTIVIDPVNGDVTFTQLRNVWHPSAGSTAAAYDDAATLLTALATDIKVQQTVTDADGDSFASSINVGRDVFAIQDDGPTAAIGATGAGVVHDETPGVQSGTGENDVAGPLAVSAANPGEDPHVPPVNGPIGYAKGAVALTSAGSATGTDGGTTAISLTLSAQGVNSLLDTTDGTSIFLFKEGSVIVGRVGTTSVAAQTGVAAFAIGIESDGKLGLVQYLSIRHPNGGAATPDEQVAIASNVLFATTTVTDGDGDTATASTSIGQLIGFQDDAPGAYTPAIGNVTNAAGNVSPPQALNFAANAGADGPKDVVFTVTEGALIADTSGQQLQFSSSPLHWHYTDVSHHTLQALNTSNALAFTLTLNSAGDSYTFDMDGSVYNSAQFSFTDVGGTVGGGNTLFKGLGIGTGDFHDILISGTDTVNTNSTEIGIGAGNNIDSGEIARFDMVSNLAVQASGPANGNTGFTHTGHYEVGKFLQKVSFVNGGPGNQAGITVTVRNGDSDFIYLGDATGEAATPNVTVKVYTSDPSLPGASLVNTFTNAAGNSIAVTGLQENYWMEVSSTDPFAIIEYSNLTGGRPIKLGAIQIETANTQTPFDLNIPINGTDGDDDTKTSQITLHFTAPVPPIMLDLNGDGARFMPLSAGVMFDYFGNGQPLHTAWADSNDGILAIDLDGDGKVDAAREFVFGGNGLTDLQGLAGQYDSNHDGLLDARDADFARFGVWQDANSNGVSDVGEFRSLSDMGIASIGLTSDGKSYSAAGGDVTVHGESTFTWADGSTGAVADASFAIAADDSATAAAMDALLANSGVSDSAVITTADLPAVQVALAEIEGTDFIDNLVNSLGSSGGSENGGAPTGGASDGALLGMLASEVGSDHGYGGMPLDLGQFADEAHALAAA